MKKVLTLTMVLTLLCGMSFASKAPINALKNAVKQDIQNTKQVTKDAIKQDLEAKNKANTEAANAKKAQKIKQIDAKLADLNAQKEKIEKSNITQTEKVLKTRPIERQIEFYTKQKEALK